MKYVVLFMGLLLMTAGCGNRTVEEEATTYPCIEHIEEVLPERIPMRAATPTDTKTSFYASTFTWGDGTKSTGTYYFCKRGADIGQNTNYCYTKAISGDKIGYSKQITTDDGTIIGYNKFVVELVVDTTDNVTMNYTNDNNLYKVIDYELVSCDWIA